MELINCTSKVLVKYCNALLVYCSSKCDYYHPYDDDTLLDDCVCNCSTDVNIYNERCISNSDYKIEKFTTMFIIMSTFFFIMCLCCCKIFMYNKLAHRNYLHNTRSLTGLPSYGDLQFNKSYQNHHLTSQSTNTQATLTSHEDSSQANQSLYEFLPPPPEYDSTPSQSNQRTNLL